MIVGSLKSKRGVIRPTETGCVGRNMALSEFNAERRGGLWGIKAQAKAEVWR